MPPTHSLHLSTEASGFIVLPREEEGASPPPPHTSCPRQAPSPAAVEEPGGARGWISNGVWQWGKGVRLVPGEGESKGMLQGLEKGGRGPPHCCHRSEGWLWDPSRNRRKERQADILSRVCPVKSRVLTYACQRRPAVSEVSGMPGVEGSWRASEPLGT